MRLRNIPGAMEMVMKSEYAISEPEKLKGVWEKEFANKNPIYIEIGMGKGRFIIDNAKSYPNINYIGIEKYPSVQIKAVQKLQGEEKLPNLRLLCINAELIENIFEKGEVDKIYLNFSDPWPKDRHAKRRLTSREYLKRYEKVLSKDGDLEFKTDNIGLFEFSLQEIEETDWILTAKTYDLHNDTVLSRNNIMTEYEEKFHLQGHPISKLVAHYSK